jgi:hypothetical protein
VASDPTRARIAAIVGRAMMSAYPRLTRADTASAASGSAGGGAAAPPARAAVVPSEAAASPAGSFSLSSAAMRSATR